jgi:hypothetical protein
MKRKDFLTKAGIIGTGVLLLPHLLFGKESLTSQKINLINQMKDYARGEMKLKLRKDFFSKWSKNEDSQYYLYVSESNRIACPKDINQYVFFGADKENAESKQKEYIDNGFHTLLYKREGAHDFTITNSLLENSNESLALVIFHEAAHQHLSKKAQLSLGLEEASCEVIGFHGARSFSQSFKELDHKKINKLIKRLENAYELINRVSSSISDDTVKNQKLYFELENNLFSGLEGNDFFMQQRFIHPVNNAYLLKNQFFSKRYGLIRSVAKKDKTLNNFVCTLEKLPKNELKAVDKLIQKIS